MCSIEGCFNNFIVNKKYNLCELHNWLRLHPNKLEKDFYLRYSVEDAFKKPKPIDRFSKFKNTSLFPKKKKTHINQVSKKEQLNKVKLALVYKKIDETRGLICEGCGTTNYLSHSHLISRTERKDLEANENNIKIHCMERKDGTKGCHKRWEGTLEEKKTLLDFEKNMKFIKEVDESIYYEILLK
jgi:hypothetical protein